MIVGNQLLTKAGAPFFAQCPHHRILSTQKELSSKSKITSLYNHQINVLVANAFKSRRSIYCSIALAGVEPTSLGSYSPLHWMAYYRSALLTSKNIMLNHVNIKIRTEAVRSFRSAPTQTVHIRRLKPVRQFVRHPQMAHNNDKLLENL